MDIDHNKILLYEVNGPFFFGIAQNFIDRISEIESTAEVVILDMKSARTLDASAIAAIKRLYNHCDKHDIKLFLVNLQEQPIKALTKMEFIKKLGMDCVFNTRAEGINAAYKYVQLEEKISV